jgi:energy-coupling factor transporter ATP-binding protein EcfA2
LDYIFPVPEGAAQLVARLQDNDWRGEIVGPHGSGKSTLLATLIPLLEEAGRHTVHVVLRKGQRRLPITSGQMRAWNERTLVVVDGYEQLAWWSRHRLDAACRRGRAGLLVTAHESVGLPPLTRTTFTLDTLAALVARLLPAGCTLISRDDMARCLEQHPSNARETLFALYDLYEARRRCSPGLHHARTAEA